MRWILALLALALSHGLSGQFVIMTEYKTNALGVIEWFEFYNPALEEVSIQGWKLESLDQSESLPFMQVPATGYSIYYPEVDFLVPKSALAFESSASVYLELRNDSEELIGSLPLVCIPGGYSFGQEESGRFHYPNPSLGLPNIGGVTFENEPLFINHPSGFYEGPLVLAVENSASSNTQWHYSLGGEVITPESPQWQEEGLILNESNTNPTELSYIEASDEYLEPLGLQDRAHTVVAKAYREGCPVSELNRRVYFLDVPEDEYNHLTVVSLNLLDDDLFGDYGIYGYGINGNNFAYRGRSWERPATITVMDHNGTQLLEQEVGLRIRGNSSRYSPQKSFKVYARNSYGTGWFENVFFPDSDAELLKRISLRSTHTDFVRSMLTDHLAMKTVEHMDVDAPDSKPVVLFLNGEFWGVYFLQEAMDDYYPESHLGINDDDVVLMEHEGAEVFPYFDELVSYASAHDMTSEEDFLWMQERIDLPSMIDYFAAQIMLANWDWPVKNMKSWYAEGEQAMRFMFYDCDACWNDFDGSGLERFYPEVNGEYESILFSKLMHNPAFRTMFALRVLDLFQEDFSPGHLMDVLESEKDLIRPLVVKHIARWRYPQTPESWVSSVESIQLFIVRRQLTILQMLDLLLEDDFLLFPNPVASGGTLNLEVEGIINDPIPFDVFDASGRLVHSGEGGPEGFQLRDLAPGTYLVRMRIGSFMRTQPIVISF